MSAAKPVKILGIVCSPRRHGNTQVLMEEALRSAREAGAEVELVSVAGKTIAPCDACESCAKTKKCKIKDDMQEIYPKLLAADGIIMGSPVYYWTVSAQAKAVIDRTYAFRRDRRLRNKVGGAIVVAANTGATSALGVFGSFFAIHRMISGAAAISYDGPEEPISVDDRGWAVVAYGRDKGAARNEKSLAQAAAMGKNIARTIARLKAAGLV